jgi:uncharacterized protein with HEPN domain
VSRDVRLYLEDIVGACQKIVRFTQGMTKETFVADERTYDAVLRNLEVLGEAAKRVPEATRQQIPEVPWRAVAGFRDFVAHVYHRPRTGPRARVPAAPRSCCLCSVSSDA